MRIDNTHGMYWNVEFPGRTISMTLPEVIGRHPTQVEPTNERDGDGWVSVGTNDELHYQMRLRSASDRALRIDIELTNRTDQLWPDSFAFNCVKGLGDHEGSRTYFGLAGRPRRLHDLPRKRGIRPSCQIYGVRGATAPADVPFVKGLQMTPDCDPVEHWIAQASAGGAHLLVVESSPALFLFHNFEYSCIHSAQWFSTLAPNQVRRAETTVSYLETTIDDWYASR